mmetsp:Transcript_8971/g.21810  ORF Transcript_8971/g.21810 Transcript_8971/m.21810 type:complete len:238 (+) Transcript_8971:131-844(+)
MNIYYNYLLRQPNSPGTCRDHLPAHEHNPAQTLLRHNRHHLRRLLCSPQNKRLHLLVCDGRSAIHRIVGSVCDGSGRVGFVGCQNGRGRGGRGHRRIFRHREQFLPPLLSEKMDGGHSRRRGMIGRRRMFRIQQGVHFRNIRGALRCCDYRRHVRRVFHVRFQDVQTLSHLDIRIDLAQMFHQNSVLLGLDVDSDLISLDQSQHVSFAHERAGRDAPFDDGALADGIAHGWDVDGDF